MPHDYESLRLLEGETLRPNDDGTVTLITAIGGEHTYDPELVFRVAEITSDKE